MTKFDWIIVGFAAFTAFMGFRRGLVRSLLSLAGLAAGAVIGARVAPHFLSGGGHSHYTALIGLTGALVGASVLQTAASSLGGLLRSTLRFTPPLRLLDSIGGLAAGAIWGLVLAWVVGAVAVQIPGHPSWHRDARRSHVLQHLNEFAPPRDVLRLRASLRERLSL
jgi:uncharacterized membrane protein required for colicin V production